MRRINSDLYAWFGKSDDATNEEGHNMIKREVLRSSLSRWLRPARVFAALLAAEAMALTVMLSYMVGRSSVEPCAQPHEVHAADYSELTSVQPISSGWEEANAIQAHNDFLHITVNQPDCDQETIRVHTPKNVIDVTIGPARVEATVNPAAVPTTRSAGVNNLRNIAHWTDASGGQVNYEVPAIPIRLRQNDSLTVCPEFSWASTGSWAWGWFSYPRFTP